MRISPRAAAVAAAVVTALASLTGAGAALASSPAPGSTQDGVQVLRFHSVGVSQVVNSAGHHGPGDVVALVFDVRTPGGAEAGKAYASCTFVRGPGPVALCHVAFVLNGGQIDAQGPIRFGPAPRFTAAVIGRTGIYEGVTGQNTNVTTSGVLDQTFFLIHPDHD
jgi:hypothetical protein